MHSIKSCNQSRNREARHYYKGSTYLDNILSNYNRIYKNIANLKLNNPNEMLQCKPYKPTVAPTSTNLP